MQPCIYNIQFYTAYNFSAHFHLSNTPLNSPLWQIFFIIFAPFLLLERVFHLTMAFPPKSHYKQSTRISRNRKIKPKVYFSQNFRGITYLVFLVKYCNSIRCPSLLQICENLLKKIPCLCNLKTLVLYISSLSKQTCLRRTSSVGSLRSSLVLPFSVKRLT